MMAEGDGGKMKKVLIIGYANKYFRTEYVKNIKDNEVSFDILTFEKCKQENIKLYGKIYECEKFINLPKLSSISVYLKFLYIILKIEKYDAIHIHSLKPIEIFFSSLLKLKSKKLISTIYGSDFYRVSNKDKNKMRKLFNKSDAITIASKKTIQDFNNYYNNQFSNKVHLIPFGNSMYDVIDSYSIATEEINKMKKEFNVPKDSFVITIGYNATKEQNHEKILKKIKKIESDLPKNYFLILPFGYGNDDYKNKMIKIFNSYKLNGICLCDYLSVAEAAKLRVISDVMIQLQDTDVLSNSMLEYIYSDNIIITGSWLPYDEISKYIIKIDSIEELDYQLINIIENFSDYKEKIKRSDRKKYIQKHYSWHEVKPKWKALY